MTSEGHSKREERIAFNYVCSVFELVSRSGYFAPGFNIRYDEKDTGNSNFVTGSGTRVYISRVGSNLDQSADSQSADSHFLMDRVISGLLISGAGLFWASPKGRIFVEAPVETLRWDSQVDPEPYYSERVRAVHKAFDADEFGSWFQFICQNTPIRRALHDAVQGNDNPYRSGAKWRAYSVKR